MTHIGPLAKNTMRQPSRRGKTPALTPEMVQECRYKRLNVVPLEALAADYGVSVETMRRALLGRGAYAEPLDKGGSED